MEIVFKYLLIVLSINCFGLANLMAAPAIDELDPRSQQIDTSDILSQEIKKIESWFFIRPMNDQSKSWKKKSNVFRVHNQQEFGVGVRYISKAKSLKALVILKVPGSPMTFTCSECKKGELIRDPIKHEVRMIRDLEPIREETAFYWGIDDRDPRGNYRMELWLNGKLLAGYDFVVE